MGQPDGRGTGRVAVGSPKYRPAGPLQSVGDGLSRDRMQENGNNAIGSEMVPKVRFAAGSTETASGACLCTIS